MTTKVCPVCQQEKPHDAFAKYGLGDSASLNRLSTIDLVKGFLHPTPRQHQQLARFNIPQTPNRAISIPCSGCPA